MKTTKTTKKLSKDEIISRNKDTINKLNELIRRLEEEVKDRTILCFDNILKQNEGASLVFIEKDKLMTENKELKAERDAMDKQIDIDNQKICDLEDVAEDYWEENKALKVDLKSLENRFDEVVSELHCSKDKQHDLQETLYEGRKKVDELDWCFNMSFVSNAKQLAKGRPAIASLASFLLQAREDYCLKYYGVDVDEQEEK